MIKTRISIHEEGTMRRDQTDAKFRHDDDQLRTRLGTRRSTTALTLAQPTHTMANLRATVWLITGLLVVWAVIVAT
jgi:hypothetical protein